MEDRSLHVPMDLESRAQFRLLEKSLGKAKALAAVYVLFRWLGYEASAGVRPGQIELVKVPLLQEDLQEVLSFVGAKEGWDALVAADFLEANEAGFYSKMFAAENEHLGADYVSMQRKGGLARSAKLQRQAAMTAATQQVRMVEQDLFIRVAAATGRELEPEQKNRCLMLVKVMDNVTQRRARLTSEFAEGLVTDAARVAERYSDEEIERVMQMLMVKRNEPNPPRTEDILRNFDSYAAAN